MEGGDRWVSDLRFPETASRIQRGQFQALCWPWGSAPSCRGRALGNAAFVTVSSRPVWMWWSQRSPALYRSRSDRSWVIIILLSQLYKNAFRNCFAKCFYILNILKKHQELSQNLASCSGLLIYRQEKREWVPKTVRRIGLPLSLIITAIETSGLGSAGNSCQGWVSCLFSYLCILRLFFLKKITGNKVILLLYLKHIPRLTEF